MAENPIAILGKENIHRPAECVIRISGNGYVAVDFSYPAEQGETWRRGADGPDGNGERALKMALYCAQEFARDPKQDPYELRNKAMDLFPREPLT